MAYDRFLIAPFNSGLQKDLRPWLIPEDAFAELKNAYVFRGRVRKRFGSTLMGQNVPSLQMAPFYSRLRINLGNTDPGTGNLSGKVPGAQFKPGQAFTVGTQIFTVPANGAPVTLLSTGTGTGTYNTTGGSSGNFTITNADKDVAVYFYPGEPVMGLTNYEDAEINNEPSYAFDTQFAYVFTGDTWERSTGGTTPTWHGSNSDFYWATNWQGVTPDLKSMFVSNFQANIGTGAVTDDPIWSFDGTNWSPFSYSPTATINTTNIQPLTVTTTKTNGTIITGYIQTARIIVPFKDRLLLLNTIENNANGATAHDPLNPTTTGITPTNYLTSTNRAYVNRCRFSHNGTPFASNAWLEPNQIYNPDSTGVVNADGASYIDAPTEEAIVSAEYIKDRLIVYFERSTWEIVWTGNQTSSPFVWQKINTELGSESTFSAIPFDKVVLTMGSTGVHACNGANVERIDDKIPDEVFEIKNKDEGVFRVAGIRDYFTEMVYWTFPSDDEQASEVYPNRVLVYNYKNGSWALNDDCITCFGYYYQQPSLTWQSATMTWEQAAFVWNSGIAEAQFRQIIAGNQQGYVFIIDRDITRNAPVMQVSDLTIGANNIVTLTVVDHTLTSDDYIALENASGITITGSPIYQLLSVVDANTITILAPGISGTYTGGGTLARVSNIQILSKQWNPYVDKGYNVYLAKIDFGVEKTTAGQVTVDYYPSATELSMLAEGSATGMIQGTGILETSPYALYPLEQAQERLWHPVYFQTEGECIQILISLSDDQITNTTIAWEDFQLEGLVLYTQRTSARLQ